MLYFFEMSKININPSFSFLKTLLSQQRRLKERIAPLMQYLRIDEDTDMRTKRIRGMNSAGQALVEMAIILPLLLLLVIGIFEFGRAMYTKNTLTHAARAGARTAVVTPNLAPDSSYTGCSSTDPVIQSICQGLDTLKDKNNVSISVQVFSPGSTTPKSGNAAPGDSAKVTVTLTGFSSVIPIIPLPTTLSGNTAMRYE